ncbi:MAG: citrate/2-methylcitrate synthase [Candidatus Wallbacteria bacterium]
MLENFEKTSLIKNDGEELLFNKVHAGELMTNSTFAQALYLALTNRMPEYKIVEMIDTILIAILVESKCSPSTLCSKLAAQTGANLNTAMAAGLSSMNMLHGLNIEENMNILTGAVKDMKDINLSFDDQAEITVQYCHDNSIILHGYGNQFDSTDLRVKKLIDRCKELGFDGDYVKLAQSIEKAHKSVFNLDLKLNIEGLVAAILLEIGIDAAAGPAFFMIAKMPLMAASFLEVKKNIQKQI